MSAIIARRCFVSGRVQGVFYRASTRQKAVDLGVSGYACNLPDGRVEVLAVGELAAVMSLVDWLGVGPPAAQVAGVEVTELDVNAIDDVPVGFAAR
jgi:acylphosphatase